MYYRPTLELILAQGETFVVKASDKILIQADKILEFNYGGTSWFSLAADTLNLIDASTDVTIRAPEEGGIVIASYSVGGRT